jgi:replicative DNA helicase
VSLQTQATSAATPPQNLEAEAAVLGAVLVSREAAEQVADVLKPEYFYSPRNAHVFRCAQELLQRGEPVDILTVNAQLQKLGLLEMAGGSEYLAQLESSGGMAGNAVQYARLIEETAVRRGLLSASVLMHQLGSNAMLSIDDALDQAGAEILRLANERTTQDAIHISSALHDYWDRIEKLHENPDQAPGVRTGFPDLDRMTGGLQPGSLVILAARPSIGKTSLALNIAQHVAVKEHVPVAVFSLEMSRWELTQRLLCGEAGVDSYLLRTGKLGENDWAKIANAMGTLSEAELYIDDRPGVTALEMRAKARRLKMQKKIGLIVIDYVQLMSGGGRTDNRTQEVSEISRSLKRLSVELDIPVLALSQLSRAPEQRGDHRPQLSDLRESGCLTGESLVYLPGAGVYRPIAELVGQTGFSVMALNTRTWLLEERTVTNAFSTGRKPVFRLETGLGRAIRATGNHKFLTLDGWRRLDEIEVGTRLAMPRWLTGPAEQTMPDSELALLGHLIGDGCTLPRHVTQYTTREPALAKIVAELATAIWPDGVVPRINPERGWIQVYLAASRPLARGRRNPIAQWLDEMGIFGLRSHEKRVPHRVFAQPLPAIATFLRHLWSTDGSMRTVTGVYYATSSPQLARDVQSLLLRLGINAVIRSYAQQGKGRDQYHVMVMGKGEIERFLDLVGTITEARLDSKIEMLLDLAPRMANTNRDVIPAQVWSMCALPAAASRGMTHRRLQAELGMSYAGHGLYRQNVSRKRALAMAEVTGSDDLARLATSDVYWDRVTRIDADGIDDVYDLTVEGLHNFVVNDIVAHNSLEQDADVVMFLYREGVHNQEVPKNKTELQVAKHRNGPTGDVPMVFLESQTKFVSATRQSPEGPGRPRVNQPEA